MAFWRQSHPWGICTIGPRCHASPIRRTGDPRQRRPSRSRRRPAVLSLARLPGVGPGTSLLAQQALTRCRKVPPVCSAHHAFVSVATESSCPARRGGFVIGAPHRSRGAIGWHDPPQSKRGWWPTWPLRSPCTSPQRWQDRRPKGSGARPLRLATVGDATPASFQRLAALHASYVIRGMRAKVPASILTAAARPRIPT